MAQRVDLSPGTAAAGQAAWVSAHREACALARLDESFAALLSSLDALSRSLPRGPGAMVRLWRERLVREGGGVLWKRNRNAYARALVDALRRLPESKEAGTGGGGGGGPAARQRLAPGAGWAGSALGLPPPFDARPPEGALPKLPRDRAFPFVRRGRGDEGPSDAQEERGKGIGVEGRGRGDGGEGGAERPSERPGLAAGAGVGRRASRRLEEDEDVHDEAASARSAQRGDAAWPAAGARLPSAAKLLSPPVRRFVDVDVSVGPRPEAQGAGETNDASCANQVASDDDSGGELERYLRFNGAYSLLDAEASRHGEQGDPEEETLQRGRVGLRGAALFENETCSGTANGTGEGARATSFSTDLSSPAASGADGDAAPDALGSGRPLADVDTSAPGCIPGSRLSFSRPLDARTRRRMAQVAGTPTLLELAASLRAAQDEAAELRWRLAQADEGAQADWWAPEERRGKMQKECNAEETTHIEQMFQTTSKAAAHVQSAQPPTNYKSRGPMRGPTTTGSADKLAQAPRPPNAADLKSPTRTPTRLDDAIAPPVRPPGIELSVADPKGLPGETSLPNFPAPLSTPTATLRAPSTSDVAHLSSSALQELAEDPEAALRQELRAFGLRTAEARRRATAPERGGTTPVRPPPWAGQDFWNDSGSVWKDETVDANAGRGERGEALGWRSERGPRARVDAGGPSPSSSESTPDAAARAGSFSSQHSLPSLADRSSPQFLSASPRRRPRSRLVSPPSSVRERPSAGSSAHDLDRFQEAHPMSRQIGSSDRAHPELFSDAFASPLGFSAPGGKRGDDEARSPASLFAPRSSRLGVASPPSSTRHPTALTSALPLLSPFPAAPPPASSETPKMGGSHAFFSPRKDEEHALFSLHKDGPHATSSYRAPDGSNSLRTQVDRIAARVRNVAGRQRDEKAQAEQGRAVADGAVWDERTGITNGAVHIDTPVSRFYPDENAMPTPSEFHTPVAAPGATTPTTNAPLTAARLELLRSIDAKLAAKRAAKQTPGATAYVGMRAEARAPRGGPPVLSRWGFGAT